MKKIEHIGIAVKDIEKSNELFKVLFDKAHYKIEDVESEGVKTSFFKCGPNKIELLENNVYQLQQEVQNAYKRIMQLTKKDSIL